MGQIKPIVCGAVFGHWTAIEPIIITRKYGQRWIFRCRCGTEREHDVAHLRYEVNRGNDPKCKHCMYATPRKGAADERPGNE